MTHSFGIQAANWIALNADGTQRVNSKGVPMTTQEALGGANSQVMELHNFNDFIFCEKWFHYSLWLSINYKL